MTDSRFRELTPLELAEKKARWAALPCDSPEADIHKLVCAECGDLLREIFEKPGFPTHECGWVIVPCKFCESCSHATAQHHSVIAPMQFS